MDPLNTEQRRRNMQANKASGTSCEILLAKALWSKGYRYRKNDKTVTGKPDLTFKKLKIAIFADGEFWHGKDWKTKKPKISQNKEYWIMKIERNIVRDKSVQLELENKGWTVLRFWQKQIKKELSECIDAIERLISQKRQDE
jgi:DNA mismatch endonuclease Vsr